jgi:hypothetical protein
MVSMMTQNQTLSMVQHFSFTWQYLGYSGLIKAISGALLAFTGLNIEFILARQMYRVAGDLTGSTIIFLGYHSTRTTCGGLSQKRMECSYQTRRFQLG